MGRHLKDISLIFWNHSLEKKKVAPENYCVFRNSEENWSENLCNEENMFLGFIKKISARRICPKKKFSVFGNLQVYWHEILYKSEILVFWI